MATRHYNIRVFFAIVAFLLLLSGCSKVDRTAENYPTLQCPNNITGLSVVLNEKLGDYSIRVNETKSLSEKRLDKHDMMDYRDEVMKDIIHYVLKDRRWAVDYTGPNLLDCGIQGEVSVYADKELFGLPAGENLIDHCIVEESLLQCSYPDYQVVKLVKKGALMKDFFSPGIALPYMRNVRFHFDSFPESVPDEFTLTVEIPINATDWDSFWWTARTENYVSLDNNRTLVGSVVVKRNL